MWNAKRRRFARQTGMLAKRRRPNGYGNIRYTLVHTARHRHMWNNQKYSTVHTCSPLTLCVCDLRTCEKLHLQSLRRERCKQLQLAQRIRYSCVDCLNRYAANTHMHSSGRRRVHRYSAAECLRKLIALALLWIAIAEKVVSNRNAIARSSWVNRLFLFDFFGRRYNFPFRQSIQF